jgi:outer membrane protein OmpA-like peptidoglycan-associated protein
MKRRFPHLIVLSLTLIAAIFLFHSNGSAGVCEKAVQLYNQASKVKQLAEKEHLLKQALELGCHDRRILARIHNNLADIYEKQGDFQRAITGYEKAIDMDPLLPTPHLSLGDVYTHQGRPEKAARHYEKGFLLDNFRSSEQIVDSLSPIRALRVVPAVTLYFGFNRAELSAEGENQLGALLEALKGQELKPYRFRLAGHTCSLGTDEYNQTLSERRSKVVREWLEAHGISGQRLVSVGFGESKPISDNATENGRRLNRRVEIRTVGVANVRLSRSSQGSAMKEGYERLKKGERLLTDEMPENAAKQFMAALELFEKANFREGVSAALDNLVLAYRYMGNWEKAEHYRNLAQK